MNNEQTTNIVNEAEIAAQNTAEAETTIAAADVLTAAVAEETPAAPAVIAEGTTAAPAVPVSLQKPIAADSNLVVCSGVCRSFGGVRALDGINMVLTGGRIVGLLGPNGAGKTTLIKILNGLLQPDSGVVTINGHQPGVETKKVVSYLPDRTYIPDWMKVGDMLDLFTDFYADFDLDKSKEMCRILSLDRKQRIKSLSKGTKEKMQLMLVMSRKAKLYLLDEPIAGVDPAARDFILHTILTNYHEGGTVLLSTHLISEVEEVLDEAVFIHAGKVVLQDTVESIKAGTGKGVDALFREMFRFSYYPMGGAQ